MFQKAKKLAFHILPGVVRPIHILWNQVIGFIFLALATVFGFRVFRGHEPGSMQVVGGAFVVLMAWFGISAFWRARKISKS